MPPADSSRGSLISSNSLRPPSSTGKWKAKVKRVVKSRAKPEKGGTLPWQMRKGPAAWSQDSRVRWQR